jgi:peptidoglycan/xylan/chitin deacetylase (PgdA/CDA1 family)
MVADAEHEIDSHSYSHENPVAITPQQERDVLEKANELIEKVAGSKPVGNVAPWWEVSTATNELLLSGPHHRGRARREPPS